MAVTMARMDRLFALLMAETGCQHNWFSVDLKKAETLSPIAGRSVFNSRREAILKSTVGFNWYDLDGVHRFLL